MPQRSNLEPEWLLQAVSEILDEEGVDYYCISAELYHPILEEHYDVEQDAQRYLYYIRRIGDV